MVKGINSGSEGPMHVVPKSTGGENSQRTTGKQETVSQLGVQAAGQAGEVVNRKLGFSEKIRKFANSPLSKKQTTCLEIAREYNDSATVGKKERDEAIEAIKNTGITSDEKKDVVRWLSFNGHPIPELIGDEVDQSFWDAVHAQKKLLPQQKTTQAVAAEKINPEASGSSSEVANSAQKKPVTLDFETHKDALKKQWMMPGWLGHMAQGDLRLQVEFLQRCFAFVNEGTLTGKELEQFVDNVDGFAKELEAACQKTWDTNAYKRPLVMELRQSFLPEYKKFKEQHVAKKESVAPPKEPEVQSFSRKDYFEGRATAHRPELLFTNGGPGNMHDQLRESFLIGSGLKVNQRTNEQLTFFKSNVNEWSKRTQTAYDDLRANYEKQKIDRPQNAESIDSRIQNNCTDKKAALVRQTAAFNQAIDKLLVS